jgi:hypothetical protein
MIISASRRTDIPAFYAQWFMNRVRAGYCTVPNPFNPSQVTTISLRPEDVDVIVFWTRNPRPMFRHLEELDRRGYRYYFQYTLLDNPRLLDRKGPPVVASLDTFRELAGRIGPERVIWRYDPIVFSNLTDTRFHQETYARIARALRGHTYRSVISLLDMYRKLDKRLHALAGQGVEVVDYDGKPDQCFDELMHTMVGAAHQNGMDLFSCAETRDLQVYGIRPGKCIDDDYIRDVFGLEVSHRKDPSQRAACGCVVSRDIGIYETCLFGCQYCYATGSFERARLNYQAHDPRSPSLLGWYDAPPASQRRLA